MPKESEPQEPKRQESSSQKMSNGKNENEDVPEDFFDDFLKEDFMAGLDIVDEDVEDPANEKAKKESKPSAKVKERIALKKSEEQKKKSRKLINNKHDQELKKLDEELDEMRKKPDNKAKLDADNFDIRRDPEKTRQAIQQDKIKNAKRLINDIVETGLVPPGMELEVDMEQVKHEPKMRDLREKLRPRNPSVDKPKKTSRKRSKTPSKKRSKSPQIVRQRRTRSRPRKTRSRTRSPLLRARSPLMTRPPRRPRQQSPSPPRRRARRSRSPSSPRRRSRSSNNWRRRRSPTWSPRRKLRRSRSPKPTFLEEIAAKLNHMPHQQFPVYGNLTPMPIPVQPPLQVPHQEVHFFAQPQQPQAQPPAQEPYDPYDESFFIGAPSPQVSQQAHQAPPLADVGKLFNDKRIQLSDFLAITAKPALSNTASTNKLTDKVKVIRRCQDALKEIAEPIFHGPLLVRRTDTSKFCADVAVSPLLRKPPVQLPFATPGVSNTLADMDFATCCETLLCRLGLDKRIVHEEAEPVKVELTSPVPVKTKPKTTTGCQTDKELSSCKECLRRKGILYANAGVQASDGPNMSFSVSTQVCDADFYATIPRNQPLSSLTAAQLLGKQAINPMPLMGARVARPIPEPPPPPTFYSGFNPPWNPTRDGYRY